MINFKKLSEEIHSAAVERGFWEKQNSIWHCMGLVFTEIAEFVEADRANHHANLMEFEKWVDNFGLDFDIAFKENIKNTVEDELSDVVIRLLDTFKAHFQDVVLNISFAELANFYKDKDASEMAYFWISAFTEKTNDGIPERIMYMIDAVIAYCLHYDIDLFKFIKLKMEYNSHREYKHGKAY